MKNIKKFIHFLKQAECSESTIKNYTADLQAFSHWFFNTNDEKCIVNKITSIDLREYKQWLLHQKKLKPNTINRKLATLRSYLDWAEQAHLIKYRLPMPKFLSKPKLGPRWLDKKKQNQLLCVVEQRGNLPDAKERILSSISLTVLLAEFTTPFMILAISRKPLSFCCGVRFLEFEVPSIASA